MLCVCWGEFVVLWTCLSAGTTVADSLIFKNILVSKHSRSKFESRWEDTVRPWSRPSVTVSTRSTVTRFKQLWQQFTTTLHLNRSCVKVLEIWKFQNSTNNDFFAVGQGVPQLHKCIWIRSCKINTSTAQNRNIIENHIFFLKKNSLMSIKVPLFHSKHVFLTISGLKHAPKPVLTAKTQFFQFFQCHKIYIFNVIQNYYNKIRIWSL